MCNHENREAAMVVLYRDYNGIPTIWCDPCIAGLVGALNAGGLPTVASCCGHGQRPGRISLRDGRELFLVADYEAATALEQLTAPEVAEPELQANSKELPDLKLDATEPPAPEAVGTETAAAFGRLCDQAIHTAGDPQAVIKDAAIVARALNTTPAPVDETSEGER